MKKILFSAVVFFVSIQLHAQNYKSDSLMFSKLFGHILEKSDCYSDLRVLCKSIGHRLTASPQAEKAVEWGKKTLQNAGCDRVVLQPVIVPHWVRGIEQFSIQLNTGEQKKFNILGLGNAIGTDGKDLVADIVQINSKEELEELGADYVKDKIVFFNYKWDQKKVSPFNEYGNCVYYRWAGPSLAAKYGAVACVIRSAGSAYDNFAHTGSMRYDTNYNKIPAMALSYDEANQLENLLSKHKIKKGIISSTSHFEKDVLSYNVIGEIFGTDYPDEIITIGGHLDSWDVGEGAHDDGAGVVQCIDVLRTFKVLNIMPKRTIRCVLFMNEENGLKGGYEYAKQAKKYNEKHICAIETDAGGFSPRGFELTMSKLQKEKVLTWYQLFYTMGIYNFEEEGGGADITPLHKELGTPTMGLMPDPQRYFDLHHTHNDVFEQVNRRELSMGAASIAAMCYMLSEYGL
jgi:carboxypeptidase Q